MAAAKSSKIKRLFLFLLVLVVIAGLAVAVRKGRERMAQAPVWHPRPVPVHAVPVTRRKIERSISYLARLEPVATAQIAAEISARVEAVEADETDRVAKDMLLARLDDRDIRAQIDALQARIEAQKARGEANQAALASAKKTVSFLRREFGRDRKLYQQKGISASALDVSRNELDTAVGKELVLKQDALSIGQELDALKAQLDEAETRLTYTQIRAPLAGVISRRFVEPGDMTQPGSPLFSLMDRSSHRLAFDLVQEDLPLVHAGQKVLIQWPAENPKGARDSRVSKIFPSLESQTTVRAEVDLLCPCPADLRIGTFIPIRVVIKEAEGLTVPRDALVPVPGGGFSVYVVRNKALDQVAVTVTLSDDVSSLVTGSLRQGEPVAVGEYLQWVRRHQGQLVEVRQ